MQLENNTYQVQGVNLIDVAQEFGTPLYVYDAETIASQLNTMRSAFSGLKVKVKYAAKSLTNISILRFLKKEGAELDAVSIQEAQIGIQAGFLPEEILYTPNCVAFKEIKQAIDLGVVLNIDSISILEQFGDEYGDSIPCCIRINPHIIAGGNSKISTGHIDSKFGISIYQLPHLLRVVKTNGLKVIGLHMHSGSDILDADVFLRAADILFSVAKDFKDLEFLDFGSGFKVKYREQDIVTNIFDLGKKLGDTFNQFCIDYGKELEIWFEPGKFIVSEAGLLLVRTNVIKTTPATVFAGVDSGMNHLLRPMMYDAYHEIINLSNPKGTGRVYTVVGYICETDTFGFDRKISEIREGDILAIKNAGAYGFSMASNYNSRLKPAEVLILKGKTKLIRERETIDDLLRNQVEIDL